MLKESLVIQNENPSLLTDEESKVVSWLGFKNEQWRGIMIGMLVSLVLHNTAGYLSFLFFVNAPIFTTIYIPDAIIFLLFVLAVVGFRKTRPGKQTIGVFYQAFWSAVIYLALMYSIQSWMKRLPECPAERDPRMPEDVYL